MVGGDVNATGMLGIPDANIFDPVTRRWISAPPMAFSRWYPTATTLPDGRVLVTSGAQNCIPCIAAIPEVYDPATNSWTQLTNARWAVPLYPYMFVLPDGRVSDAGSDEATVITRALDVNAQTWTTIDPNPVDGGSAATYVPAKIIKSGSSEQSTSPNSGIVASSATYVLDMAQPSPAWRQTAPMNFPRIFHTLTLLPDGNVAVNGGALSATNIDPSQTVLAAEIWSPVTETWTTMAAMQVPRLYTRPPSCSLMPVCW